MYCLCKAVSKYIHIESWKNLYFLLFVFFLCVIWIFSVRTFLSMESGLLCCEKELVSDRGSVKHLDKFSSVNSPRTCSSSYSLYKFIRLVIVFIVSLFVPPNMAPVRTESTREKYSLFQNSFHPELKQIRRKLIYIYIYIYIYICVCVCVCVCVSVHTHIIRHE